MNGTKTVFCESLCGVRQYALKKDVSACGDCPELETCAIVRTIISNNPVVLKNLKE